VKQLLSFLVLCSCQLSDPSAATPAQIKAEGFATFHKMHGLVCAHGGSIWGEYMFSKCYGVTDTGAVVRFVCDKQECN
jgi:hypothetical protein